MFRCALFAVAAFATVATAAPAIAQTADKDVRCLILSEGFSKLDKDPARRQIAAAAGLYYFGRVDAQISGTALRSQLIAQRALLKGANAGELMTACAREFGEHQHNLQTAVQGAGVVPPAKK
jgi:hypothetical protein